MKLTDKNQKTPCFSNSYWKSKKDNFHIWTK